MKSLLWILALLALAVGLPLMTGINEGYVIFVMPPYRAEISLYFAIVLTILGFVVLYTLLRILLLLISLPRRMRESSAQRKRDKAAKAFGEGVRLYLAGEQREAIDTLSHLNDGIWAAQAASLAARAAGEIGETEEEHKWHSRAIELDPRIKPLAVAETSTPPATD